MSLDFSELHLVIGNKRYSSWSQRAWLALKLADLPFHEEVLPLRSAGFADARAAADRLPAGRVPVLRIGDATVWDSLAILETLAEREPARFWPADPRARALARSAVAEMHSGFAALRGALPAVYGPRLPLPALTDEVRADIARIEQLWARCRAEAATDEPFLFGPFSAADCFFAPVVTRFDCYGAPVSAATRAYVEAVLAQSFVVEWYAAATAEPWRLPPEPTA